MLEEGNSYNNYKWKLKECDLSKILSVSRKYELSEILSRLLIIRNIEYSTIESYLNPMLKNTLKDPNHLLDMEKGVDIVYNSIINKEKIVVFGDYDVDGITSTALMKNFFNLIGYNISTYIPDRMEEGYGPNIDIFKKFKEQNYNLIITVDCGIASYDSIKYGKEIGLKIVVTDHHKEGDELPPANAIINPNRIEDTTEYKNLAGVGVVFLFIISLNRKLREYGYYKNNNIEEPNLLSLLDLVALGTICDLVPIVGINRAFVKQGLKVIYQQTNVGLKRLLEIANIDEKINVYHVGFLIGPRINAIGRISNANDIIELFWTKDNFKAYKLAKYLEDCNNKRQIIEKEVTDEVISQIKNNNLDKDNVIVVYNKGWHEGVIGIIASRIKDKYDKPTIVFTELDDCYKGSCRSVNGTDIGSVIISAKSKGIILSGGGHSMAGGMKVEKSKLNLVIDYFKEQLNDKVTHYLEEREIEIDLQLECKSLTVELALEIDKLGPFGVSNHKPLILLKDVIITHYSLVGINKNNLMMRICDNHPNTSYITAMYFRISSDDKILSKIKPGIKASFVGELSLDKYKGVSSVKFIVKDVKF